MSVSKHRCEVCDLSFTSYQHYSIHLGGRLHNEKQRRQLEAEVDFVQGPSRITDSAKYLLSSANQYTGTNVDSVSTGLHSCLKQPKSSVIATTSSSQSHHSSMTVASPQTDSLYSSHLSSYSEFASPHGSWQLDKQDANGCESYRSQGLPWKEEQNILHANNMTKALAQTPSSSSKDKSSILTLLAAQRLLQDKPLEEKSPKKPAKVEVKSKDSVRSLLSAQFDLLKSYMTEPEKVKTSPGQDLSRLKPAERSGASLSTTVGSTVMRNQHSLEAADRYSTDRSVGQRSQGLVKTPSDFWSKQATYAGEVQSDPSSIPFLGEGYVKDEGVLEEQQASFVSHSHDQVAASPWNRNDDSASAGQWDRSSDHAVKTTQNLPHSHDRVAASTWNRNDDSSSVGQRDRSSDHAVKTTHADVSKGSGPIRSDVPGSGQTWQSRTHDEVKSSVLSDAWEPRKDGLETVERTYNDKQQCTPNEEYYTPSQLVKPLFSSENSRMRPAAGAYQHQQQQQMPSFRDDFRRPVRPLMETNLSQSSQSQSRSQSSMEEFMAQVKQNLQRDLKHDFFLTTTSSLEVSPDFGRSYPVAAPLQPPVNQRKVLLETPSAASKPFGTSINASTTSAVAKKKILLPTPPVAGPAMAQSSTTSLGSSSTGVSWSQPDGRGGIPSQQQPRFSSSTHGGGRPIGSDGSNAVRPPPKKTLLSTPLASCLQPGSYGNSSSSAVVVSLPKQSPLLALPAKSSPLSRNLSADKNLVNAAASKTLQTGLPSQPLPVKSSLTSSVAASKPQPSSGKSQAVSTFGSEKSEMEEVDPQLKLQKEIEVVMAERVEDLMKSLPESMMRSIMDGKVPLEFLDKISDLIPTEVIEEAVRQKEQLAADKCTSAGSGHLATGTSRMPLVVHQVMVGAKAGTGQISGDGAESNKMKEHHLEKTAVSEVATELNLGGKVELVKKMVDEILGDLANETGAPSNTDILEKLTQDDRNMVLEMQDVAGIRDVSVTIEILEFFRTLDRNLLLTLSTIPEKEGEGESMLKRMTKLMLNNYSKKDPCKSTPTQNNSGSVMQKTDTKQSQTIATNNATLRSAVQPCITKSSTVVAVQQNKFVAGKKPEVQSVSFTPKSNVVSEKQTGSPCIAQIKSENPESKAPLISLSKTPSNAPSSTTGVMEKPVIKAPSVLPQNKASVSETVGVKATVSNVPQTVTASPNKPAIKATFGLRQNSNIVCEKTPPCAPQAKPGVAGLSFSNASRTGVGSVAAVVKSELQGVSCNPQNKAVAAQMSETKIVSSNLQNLSKGSELSTVIGASVPVEKTPSVGVTADSKPSTISQSQKAAIAVAGKTELKGTSEGNSMKSSGILKTPEVRSSAVKETTTSSDKLGISSSGAALIKTETIEAPELKGADSNAQNNISNEESRATVALDIQQAKSAVPASTSTEAVAAIDTGAVTSSAAAKQSESSLTDKTESDKLSEMGTKTDGQSVCSSLDLTLAQPCNVDIQPAEQMSNEKAEKRKATEPLEPNKKAKLEETSAIVSEKSAMTPTTTTSTVLGTQLKTSYVESGSSTMGKGPQCQFASPRVRPLLQSPKPRTVLLPTPVQPRPVPFRSPCLDVWNKQPPQQAPFPPRDFSSQRPRLPQALMAQFPPGSLEQKGPAPVRQLMPAHGMPRPPPHELPHRPPCHELLHPPEAPRNLMPGMRARAPPLLPEPVVRTWPPDAPFRNRNSGPMNLRPCLPNPSLNQLPPRPLMHGDNSFRFRGPNMDNFGPPPFKRWR